MCRVAKRRPRVTSDTPKIARLKQERARLNVRLASLRARLAEVETALRDVDAAIQREHDVSAIAIARRYADMIERVLALIEQNVAPSMIAETLQVPEAAIAEIVAERQAASRLRRGRHLDHD